MKKNNGEKNHKDEIKKEEAPSKWKYNYQKHEEPVKEYHYHHYGRGFNPGRFFLGLVIAAIGLFYLASNMGWIPANLNFEWWKFWPVIIIFIGLSMLSRGGWFTGLIGMILGLAVIAMIGLMIFGNFKNSSTPIKTVEVSVQKDAAAKSAVINFYNGAGKLNLKGGSDLLATGTVQTNNDNSSVVKSSTNNGEQTVTIDARSNGIMVFGGTRNLSDLKLNSNTPYKLNFNFGSSDSILDLSDLFIDTLDIHSGASSIGLTLGAKSNKTTANIEAGATSLNLALPKTAGIKIVLHSNLSSQSLNGFVIKDSNTYQTPNYDTAAKKIDINLNIGVSSFNVELK